MTAESLRYKEGKNVRFEIKSLTTMQEALERLCEFLIQENIPSGNVFDSKLVVSELIGNVLKHSNGIASLEWGVDGEFIRLKINSTSPFTPPETSGLPHVYAEHGRGLFLVDSVCEERITTEDGGILVRIKIQG